MGTGRGVKLRLVCLVSMHGREPCERLGAAGNTLAGGNFCGRAQLPCRKREERERHDALRRDCIVAGMLHSGPVLRTRPRTTGSGRVQPTTASSPSQVGVADSTTHAPCRAHGTLAAARLDSPRPVHPLSHSRAIGSHRTSTSTRARHQTRYTSGQAHNALSHRRQCPGCPLTSELSSPLSSLPLSTERRSGRAGAPSIIRSMCELD